MWIVGYRTNCEWNWLLEVFAPNFIVDRTLRDTFLEDVIIPIAERRTLYCSEGLKMSPLAICWRACPRKRSLLDDSVHDSIASIMSASFRLYDRYYPTTECEDVEEVEWRLGALAVLPCSTVTVQTIERDVRYPYVKNDPRGCQIPVHVKGLH